MGGHVVSKLPTYLQEPPEAARTYGTLEWSEEKRSYLIFGEPPCLEAAQRVFPGCVLEREWSPEVDAADAADPEPKEPKEPKGPPEPRDYQDYSKWYKEVSQPWRNTVLAAWRRDTLDPWRTNVYNPWRERQDQRDADREAKAKRIVRFPATPRLVAELNWFLQRYPLKINCKGKFWEDREKAIEHAKQREQNVHIKGVKDLPGTFLGKLYPFQEEGVAWMVRNPHTLLADETGLGKTVTSLAATAKVAKYPVLVVAERPELMRQWQSMIGAFLDVPAVKAKGRKRKGQQALAVDADDEPRPTNEGDLIHWRGRRMAHIIKGIKPYDLPNTPFIIIHYGQLAAWKQTLQEHGFQVLIYDEIQQLRHIGTQKYSAASDLGVGTEYTWGLSATPIYGMGGQMWAVMNAIAYHCLGDQESFTKEWCDGYGSLKVLKPDMLNHYLREEGLMLRRKEEEVGIQLPPRRNVVHEIDSDQDKFAELAQEAIALAHGYDSVKDWAAKGRLKRLIEEKARRATGVAKAPYVASFIKGLVEAGEHVLVAAHHHDVENILLKALSEEPFNAVRVTGQETPKEREAAKQAFKEGKAKVLILGLRSSSGTDGLQGIGTVCVVAELDWSPSVHHQFSGRLRRIGMREDLKSLLCYFMVSNSPSDQTMQEALGLKIGQFVGVMGDKAPTEEDSKKAEAAASEHMDRVITALRRHAKPDSAFDPLECKHCEKAIYQSKQLGRIDPEDQLAECSECYLNVMVDAVPLPEAIETEPY